MKFTARQFARNGAVLCKAAIEDIFPLLCPKKEEEWIPGWECETIWSNTGYNEDGAIFKTLKPYGAELYWTTLKYDIKNRIVDFLITAPHLYMFRFTIELFIAGNGIIKLIFSQVFTSVSEEGNALLKLYESEDFDQRLKYLEELMHRYLQDKKRNGRAD